MSATDIAEVVRERLLGRIPKQFPREILEYLRRVCAQSLEHEPHHDRAAFDVVGAGPEDAVAFRLPAEVVARLLLRRKDCVEMRHHCNGALGPPTTCEHKMVAVARID